MEKAPVSRETASVSPAISRTPDTHAGALARRLASVRNLVGAALLALAPAAPTVSAAPSSWLTDAYQSAVAAVTYTPVAVPKSTEIFNVGSVLASKTATERDDSICRGCCDGREMPTEVGAGPEELNAKYELTPEHVASLKGRLKEFFGAEAVLNALPTGEAPDDEAPDDEAAISAEIGAEIDRIYKVSLKLDNVTYVQIPINEIRKYLKDSRCMKDYRDSDRKMWVVTHMLVAEHEFIFEDSRGSKINFGARANGFSLEGEGEGKLNFRQSKDGDFKSTEPLVIGYKSRSFRRKRFSRDDWEYGENSWQERRDRCEEAYEDYCDDLAQAEEANEQCEERLSYQAGFMRVTISEADEWTPNGEVCTEVTLGDTYNQEYDPDTCTTLSPDGHWCADQQELVLIPDENSRLIVSEGGQEPGTIRVTQGDDENWTVLDRGTSTTKATATVLAYNNRAKTVEFCMPQEELQTAGTSEKTDYALNHENDVAVTVPGSGEWEIVTYVEYYGQRVEGPEMGIREDAQGDLERSTDQLQLVGIEPLEDGNLTFRYEVLPPCEVEDLPKSPDDCINCGYDLKCD